MRGMEVVGMPVDAAPELAQRLAEYERARRRRRVETQPRNTERWHAKSKARDNRAAGKAQVRREARAYR